MLIFKCKNCGGDIPALPNENTVICGSCHTTIPSPTSSEQTLFKLGKLMLSEGDFEKADGFFNELLAANTEFAPAYIGKLCAELGLHYETQLDVSPVDFSNTENFRKALSCADEQYRRVLEGYMTHELAEVAQTPETKRVGFFKRLWLRLFN